MKNKFKYLFETSWEVCNKVGGIYTVLSTKARVLKEAFGDGLIFIGPELEDSAIQKEDFIERKTLLKNASSRLKLPYGITIRTGRWNIPGSPIVVLIKYDDIDKEMDDIYGKIWEKYGVDSLHANGDYAPSCEFAVAAAEVIAGLTKHLKALSTDVAAHFDEWTTGMGLLWLELINSEIATLFTAHATCIGRSICSNGKPLYDYFDGYNGDVMAVELNMESKHSLESRAARHADCFTAVSELTAKEAEQLLGVRPQVVTPNGFESDFVPSSERYELLREEGRKKILSIASALRNRNYDSDTMIVATSGRNEFRNKGLDIFIDALATADYHYHGKREILGLILVPAWVKEPSHELSNRLTGKETIIEPDFITHRLNNEDSDAIFQKLEWLEKEGVFHNVSVIYVPCYLDGRDGIVNISYYDLLPAVDMTVFASYYEPWGYTPLESVSFGHATVTTDKSGFGRWILAERCNGLDKSGVEVVERTDSNYSEVVHKISDMIIGMAEASQDEVKKIDAEARETAAAADWKEFIDCYYKAFEVARERRDKRILLNNF